MEHLNKEWFVQKIKLSSQLSVTTLFVTKGWRRNIASIEEASWGVLGKLKIGELVFASDLDHLNDFLADFITDNGPLSIINPRLCLINLNGHEFPNLIFSLTDQAGSHLAFGIQAIGKYLRSNSDTSLRLTAGIVHLKVHLCRK